MRLFELALHGALLVRLALQRRAQRVDLRLVRALDGRERMGVRSKVCDEEVKGLAMRLEAHVGRDVGGRVQPSQLLVQEALDLRKRVGCPPADGRPRGDPAGRLGEEGADGGGAPSRRIRADGRQERRRRRPTRRRRVDGHRGG